MKPRRILGFGVRVSHKASKVKLNYLVLEACTKTNKILGFIQGSAFDIMTNESTSCYFGATFK